ncbi:NAD(P)-dependent oxidoreductase [Labrys miyagiensis]|uniref:NAD(P)-dependent oxidoreductase n=1 Tax=Labrys miyagiensis TaxID=346912 RepID=A0ABQ6CUP3_9HYPH|nr:SDR family oxidoreductase [Labrys miyagiensis]GLS24061.1 NAD(P)-dependent oxidoreductase [Labrys miyagiensis]
MTHPRILVAAASGQLGRLVVDGLLESLPASQIVAGVRNPDGDAAKAFAAKGVEVRKVDYADPAGLAVAFIGIDRLLLISSNAVGHRLSQHSNAIAAAKQAGVKLIAYTSILHADTTPLGLGDEHKQTEAALRESGVPFALLRNGWYTENYAASIAPALAHGAFLGAAGDGRISTAARADYARAAAAVLTSDEDQGGRIYELAGDNGFTLAEFAAEIAKVSGKPVVYKNLSEPEFKAALVGAGLPEGFAGLLADSDAGAAKGALFDDSGQLSKLTGRPTTPYAQTIAAAVKG